MADPGYRSPTTGPGGPAGATPHAIVPAGTLVAVLLVVLSLGTAQGSQVSRQETVHEGGYLSVSLPQASATNPWKIEVTWTSSAPIDVWLVDADALENYHQGRSFAFDLQQNGTSGQVTFTVPASRLDEGPFYLLLDNTETGSIAPPPGAPDDAATVSVTGETRDTATGGGAAAANRWGDLLLGLAVLGALALAIVLVVRMRRKGPSSRGPGGAVTTGGAEKNGMEHEGEAEAGQTGSAADTPPSASGACGACGTPITVETTFCPSCGAQV